MDSTATMVGWTPAPIFKPYLLTRIERDEKTMTRRTNGLQRINWEPARWIGGTLRHDGIDPRAFEMVDIGGRTQALRFPYGLNWYLRERLERYEDHAHYGRDGQPVLVNGERVPWRWKRDKLPSIHMPKECARTLCTVQGVSLQRLADISNEDAIAEGVDRSSTGTTNGPRWSFFHLWDTINGPGAAALNPWCWVISFERVRA